MTIAATVAASTKTPAAAVVILSAKVRELANKAPYHAPKLVSFPVGGAKLGEALSFAGNTLNFG